MASLQNHRGGLALATAIVVAFVLSAQPAPPVPGIREDVAGMSADHPVLASYRKAIEEMKKLPSNDPLSWEFQANMHGAPMAAGDNKGWRWCMHGNWWFLPWHRGYLHYFERIVRKMSNDDSFRLPYWAWEKEGQNVLPAPFREPKSAGQENVLFDATRVDAANAGRPLRPESALGSFSADWELARKTDRFTTDILELSYGGLRGTKTQFPNHPETTRDHGVMESHAHDLIHDAVGDDTGNMGNPDTAARDPIFWLHHANVDRLWNRWLDIKTHHLPDPVADKDWYDQQFLLYDENRKEVVVTVSQILAQASRESRYDDDERRLISAAPPARERTMNAKTIAVGSVQPRLVLGTKPLVKPLEINEDAKPRLMEALNKTPGEAEPSAILLRVEGIKPPKDTKLAFEVFLTKKGEKPSKSSYVGPISFFGRRGEHAQADKEGFTQGFDVTNLVQRIRSANKGKLPELEVSVVPHSTTGLSDADLAKRNIEIPIANITLKLLAPEQKK